MGIPIHLPSSPLPVQITNCLPQEQVNEHLEPPILAALQVVPDLHQFQQKEVRLSTQATYKQSKFNLLREENEGYAALINALANGTGPPTIPVYSQEAEASQRGLSSLVQVIEQETPSERNSRAKSDGKPFYFDWTFRFRSY